MPCVIVAYIPGKDLVVAKTASAERVAPKDRYALNYVDLRCINQAHCGRESRRAVPQVTLMHVENIKLYSKYLALKEVVRLPVVEL